MSDASSAGSLSMLFAQVRGGVPGARDALIVGLQLNLRRLTAAILSRHFPIVARKREVDSVVQDLNRALLRATETEFKPKDVQEFIALAARCLRSLLIDEAEKIRRRRDFAPQADPDQSTAGGPPERVAEEDSASVLLQWEEFQRVLQSLEDDERVIFDMHFHMKVPHSEIAEVLGMQPKQVSRAWLAAGVKLKGHIPKFDTPRRVLLVTGGDAFAGPAVRALFDGWRAFQVNVAGGADRGEVPGREALDRADVVAVTRPEYVEWLRAKAGTRLGEKPVVCLDIPDAFDASNKADVNALWQKLTKHLDA